MKKYFCIILVCLSQLTIAQEFKTSVAFSTGVSWFTSSNPNFYPVQKNSAKNLAFSAAISEEYYMPKLISFGMELNYRYMYNYFSSSTPPEISIPEYYSKYQHSLATNIIEMPLIVKIRTQKDISKGSYLVFGSGLSYFASAKRKVEIYKGYMNEKEPSEIIPIVEGKLTLKTAGNSSIGTFTVVGIGKKILIKNQSFFFELKYRFDTSSWVYPTAFDSYNSSFDLKRQTLLFNLGYTF